MASYLVVGTGAVGTFLASTLGKNGARVFLKARSSPKREVAKLAARSNVRIVQCYDQLQERLAAEGAGPLQAVFLATKTYSLPEAAEQLVQAGPALEPTHATIGCYNGHVIGLDEIFGQRTWCKALVPGGYTLRPDGSGFDVTNAGQKWSLLSREPAVKTVAASMNRHGVATIAGGFEADTRKYLVNTTANLLSVIANTNCNGLVGDRHLTARMRSIFREAAHVLLAAPEHKAHFPTGVTLRELEDQILSGIAAYGEHYPSSCKDFRAGRPIEVDSLNGYIVALGERLGIPTPVNSGVVDDINVVLKLDEAPPKLPESPRTSTPTPPAPWQRLFPLPGTATNRASVSLSRRR